MKKTLTYCDICKEEVFVQNWETTPKKLCIITECADQNPMVLVTRDKQYKRNTYQVEDVCESCMMKIAKIISEGICALQASIETGK